MTAAPPAGKASKNQGSVVPAPSREENAAGRATSAPKPVGKVKKETSASPAPHKKPAALAKSAADQKLAPAEKKARAQRPATVKSRGAVAEPAESAAAIASQPLALPPEQVKLGKEKARPQDQKAEPDAKEN